MIYLDNAATTKIASEVVDSMLPYLYEDYGNPSSVHSLGVAGKKAINQARRKVAKALNANPDEIYFTSGGTESDNLALIGVAEAFAHKGKHIITTKVEHHAILHTCQYLEKRGYEITYLKVDEKGKISLDELENAIREDTILISVMFANNEIGTIEPIAEIGEIAKKHKVLFHTDAVQAFGHVNIDVKALNVDLLSISGHKIHGPKGVGSLYIRDGVRIGAHIHGGGQERDHRSGTENVAAIVGLGVAAERSRDVLESNCEKMTKLRDFFMDKIEEEIPYVSMNGDRVDRLCNNVNVTIEGIDGEALVIMLDMKGICCSSGSACTSTTADPSHVLEAIGHTKERAKGSVRFTLSGENTMEELEATLQVLKEIVARMREMSPGYKDFLRRQNK